MRVDILKSVLDSSLEIAEVASLIFLPIVILPCCYLLKVRFDYFVAIVWL